VDLLQTNDGDCLWVAGGTNEPAIQELAKRAKACITSMQAESCACLLIICVLNQICLSNEETKYC
jgi:hypothetical protein